jgi:hypothetical protein
MFRIERGATADHWNMPSRHDYPVRADLVRKNILGVAGLETIEPRTDKPDYYDRLQVSEPDRYKPADEAAKSDPGPILLRLVDADAKSMAAVILGKAKSFPVGGKPGQIHVRKPDEARAWLAQGIVEAPADPAQWLVKDMIKLDRSFGQRDASRRRSAARAARSGKDRRFERRFRAAERAQGHEGQLGL